MLILASIVLLRVILTFVIHWEIESDTNVIMVLKFKMEKHPVRRAQEVSS